MGTVHAIGDPVRVQGWVLAGVDVRPAHTAAEARAVWADLPADAGVVVVTADVAQALADLAGADGPLLAVLPR
jgi:vacuolar-type H+-ATPase subunit F/Vma7